MSTSQAFSLGPIAIEGMENSRGFLLGLLTSLSDEQLATRAGGAGNHALWIMGHIAQSDDAVVSAFTDELSCLPVGHDALFAAKSSVSDNAADYPSRDELFERMTIARERVVRWVKSLDDQSCIAEAPGTTGCFCTKSYCGGAWCLAT